MMTELKILAYDDSITTTPAQNAYTVPTGKAVVIKAISLTNKNAAARTSNVYLKVFGSGLAIRIWPKDLSLASGANQVVTAPWCISAGDEILWDVSGSDVEGIISGIVVTAQ